MSTTSSGADNIFRQLALHFLIPDSIDPDDFGAVDIGETNILTDIFTDMLVDYGAHALLVLMVAVEECQLLLHQLLSFCNINIVGRETTILVLNHEVDTPFFVKNIAVIVASQHFCMKPCLLRNNIVLSFQDTDIE